VVFGALQLIISQLPDLSALKVRPASPRGGSARPAMARPA